MDIEMEMNRFEITRKAWETAGRIFVGIAIPCDKSTADGGTIRSEKVLKFAKSTNKQDTVKVDPRNNGGEDTMLLKVGKPGSQERLAALAEQYAKIEAEGTEQSPFGWDD